MDLAGGLSAFFSDMDVKIVEKIIIYATIVWNYFIKKGNSMSSKNPMSRITVDIPKEDYKRLKALAAALGKTMQQLVSEAIRNFIENAEVPHEETLKVLKDAEKRKKRVKVLTAEEILKLIDQF